jgi:hypothetical protein
MRNHVIGASITVAVVLLVGNVLAARTYTQELTVGDGVGYDYDNINDAISAMKGMSPPLGPGVLGCIWVSAGTYYEHLNDNYAPDGSNLPAYCDLIGTEKDRRLGGMITVLTEAVKGLNEKIEALEVENQILKAEIAALKAE